MDNSDLRFFIYAFYAFHLQKNSVKSVNWRTMAYPPTLLKNNNKKCTQPISPFLFGTQVGLMNSALMYLFGHVCTKIYTQTEVLHERRGRANNPSSTNQLSCILHCRQIGPKWGRNQTNLGFEAVQTNQDNFLHNPTSNKLGRKCRREI